MFADQQIWPLKTSWMADFIYKKLCPPEDFKYQGSCEMSTVKKKLNVGQLQKSKISKYLKTLTNKLYISKLEVIENSFWSTDYAKKYSGYVRFAYLYLSPSSSKSHYGEIDGTIKSKKKNAYRFVNKKVMKVTEEKSVIFT